MGFLSRVCALQYRLPALSPGSKDPNCSPTSFRGWHVCVQEDASAVLNTEEASKNVGTQSQKSSVALSRADIAEPSE